MENEEEIMKVVKILYEAFQINGIKPGDAVSAMVYMIASVVQLQYKNPRELICAISQDLLNLSQVIGKSVSEVKEN